MPSKRGRARAPQHVPVIQSDYDTDGANMTDTAAPVSRRTNEELNLAVLKRHDPSVQDVLGVANFAVVYLFSPTSQQWEKCGIEGTLFVCELTPEEMPGSSTPIDRFNVIIINRKGMDNFSTEIYSTEDVEITDEYVIIQVEGEDGTPQIYGLWIFSEPPPSSTAETRRITAEKIYECALRAEGSRQVAEEEASSSANAHGNGNADESAQHAHEQEVFHTITDHVALQSHVGRQVSMNELFAQQPLHQIQQAPQDQPKAQQHPQQLQQHHYQPQPQHQHYQQQQDMSQFFQQPHIQHSQLQNGHPQQYGALPSGGVPPEYMLNQMGMLHQQQFQQQQQRDVIGDLFRNAKQGYNG